MDRSEKAARLKSMLQQLAPNRDPAALRRATPSNLEGFEAETEHVSASVGLEKIATNRVPTDAELIGLEAIVMPRERPVAFVRDDLYSPLEAPWMHLNDDRVRDRFKMLMPSIGRIELPNSTWIPYGGTGFVVGPNLLMTNRHVAGLFAQGLGVRNLVYHTGDAAIDFKREVDTPESESHAVRVAAVVMIHPYWDMAILRVEGLPATSKPLTLATGDPSGMIEAEVAAIGYPARDDRNDLATQDRIFQRTYNVKRFQPGKLRPRDRVRSFGNDVNALIHNCSTLGGNSGSAIVDIATGQVVALHFGGAYLKANYSVPAYELARDSRVADAGVNFANRLPATNEWDDAWRLASGQEANAPMPKPNGLKTNADAKSLAAGTSATFTIPLNISVTIGQPALSAAPVSIALAAPSPSRTDTEAPRMQVPILHDHLETRTGYRPDFLDLDDGEKVNLPKLTSAGENAVSTLDDGSSDLKYHKFSVVMHKLRRLALFTACNVDWRKSVRLIDGRKPSRRELTGLAEGVQEQWVTDPRIPEGHQLPDVFFTKDDAKFDKGHLIRRDDVCWGSSFDDIQKSNGDTYHTTNCSPQVLGFNRSAGGVDNWGDLENLVQSATKAEKVCVFSGPVLAEDDRFFPGRDDHGAVSVRIPRAFWKIIVANASGKPAAYGFVLEQDLTNVPLHEEFIVPPTWKRFMKSIDDIEKMLGGLAKLNWFKKHDQFESNEGRQLAGSVRSGVRHLV